MENNSVSQPEPTRNTKKGSAGNYQHYRFQFTLPADEPYMPEEIDELLRPHAKEFYFQLEEGESGYMHWQGCFSLIKKEYISTAKMLINQKAHIEIAKNWHSLKQYCQKNSTRKMGPFSHESVYVNVIKELLPWQKNLEDELLMENTNDRKIIWYYNLIGGMGKSSFAKYMAVKHKACVLQTGAKKDMAFMLPDNPKIVIFDFARTIEGHVNFDAIECVKNGMIMSAKYESRMKIFDSPHVVIFANFPPEKNSMSLDRWDIREY